MPTTALVQKKKTVAASALFSYSALRLKVKERLFLGQKRIEGEQVRTYWEIGRLINDHIMIHGGKAEYGKNVLGKLEQDLDIHERNLYYAVEFYRAFPILNRGSKLPWRHYRALLTLDDGKKRMALAEQAEKKNWTKEELEAQIQKLKGSASGSGRPKKSQLAVLQAPTLGVLYTYRIFQPKSIDANVKMPLKVDLGFQVYLDLTLLRFPKGLKEGDIVRAESNSNNSITKSGTTADLFTYRAAVEDVTDGDTLRVHIDLGLGASSRQYLRLTHINGPELKTKEGKAAREFVLREIRRSPIVKLRSTKHDLFDRYLADVFLEDGTYLNQRILDAGHAVRIQLDTTK